MLICNVRVCLCAENKTDVEVLQASLPSSHHNRALSYTLLALVAVAALACLTAIALLVIRAQQSKQVLYKVVPQSEAERASLVEIGASRSDSDR